MILPVMMVRLIVIHWFLYHMPLLPSQLNNRLPCLVRGNWSQRTTISIGMKLRDKLNPLATMLASIPVFNTKQLEALLYYLPVP